MDNHDRRVNYVHQNHPELTREQCAALVTGLYLAGREDLMGLKPGQRRRLKNKQAPTQPQLRGREPHVVIYDEAQPHEFKARDMRFPTQMTQRPRMNGKVREYIDARLAQNVRRAVARGR